MGRFREGSGPGKVQRRFREGSGKVQGRFRKGMVQGWFREGSRKGKVQERFREGLEYDQYSISRNFKESF